MRPRKLAPDVKHPAIVKFIGFPSACNYTSKANEWCLFFKRGVADRMNRTRALGIFESMIELRLMPMYRKISFSIFTLDPVSCLDLNSYVLMNLIPLSLSPFGEKQLTRLLSRCLVYRMYFLLLHCTEPVTSFSFSSPDATTSIHSYMRIPIVLSGFQNKESFRSNA